MFVDCGVVHMRETMKKQKNKKETWFVIGMVVLIATITGLPYLMPGLGCHLLDTLYHLSRIESVKEAILNGAYPARVNPMFLNGYGYGSSLFYSDITLVVPAILRMLGVTPILSWKIFVLCLTMAASCTTYYSLRYISDNIKYSITGTVLLLLSQYYLGDLHSRAGISEYAAFVFLPLLFAGIYDYFAKEGKRIWLLGVAFGGLILTHTITTLICFMVTCGIFVSALLFEKTRKELLCPDKLKRLWITALLTVGVSAYFVFPMLEQMLTGEFWYQQSWAWIGDNTQPLKTFFYLKGNFGVIAELGIGIPILLLLVSRLALGKIKNRWADAFLLLGVLLFMLSTDIFPWKILNNTLFNAIQFTYRLWPCALCAVILGIVVMLSEKLTKGGTILCVATIALSVAFGIYFHSDYRVAEETLTIDDEFLEYNTIYIGQAEYLPAGVSWDVRMGAGEMDVVQAMDGPIALERSGYAQYRFSVEEASDIYVLPLIYYKGYTAKLYTPENPGDALEVLGTADGLVQVNKEASDAGEIVVCYGGTLLQRISEWISLITLIGIVVYIARKRCCNIQKIN